MGTFSPTEGGLRYSAIPPELSSAGGVPQGNALGVRPAQVRPSVQPIQRSFVLFSVRFLCSSCAVLRLWQEWHRLCRFLSSVNTVQSPLWSRMWSTSVALTRSPLAAQARQKGSFSSCADRSPSVFLWLVGRAVAPGDQNPAPGSPARSQWPIAHGLSPPRQNKRARTDTVRMLRNMRLRLIGSGSNRYLKIALVCSAGSRDTPSPVHPAEGGSGASSGTVDTVPKRLFRLSPTVYHSRS